MDVANGVSQQQPEAEPAPSQAEADTGAAGLQHANGDVEVCQCCRGDRRVHFVMRQGLHYRGRAGEQSLCLESAHVAPTMAEEAL